MLVAVLLAFLCCLGSAAAGKVLVIPMEGSHWLSMKEVLIELSKRGHEIIVMAPEMKTIVDSSEWYTLRTYPVPLKEEEMEELLHSLTANSFNDQPFIYRFLNIWDIFKKSSALFEVACSSLLHNKEMMKFIEESKFDVLFTDPVTPCGQIIALHFSIPSAFFLRAIPYFEATQCPNPPSYVPRGFTEHTDHMSFLQRVKNLVFDVQNFFLCDFMYQPYSKLASELLQRDVTVLDLLRKASVWLLRLDFVLDYPRPLMPNIILIGGVNCAHKQLPQVGRAPFLLLFLTDWFPRDFLFLHKKLLF
uniref:glucuronosyltransferase n=1 Tax=Cairina moschata TaxID=8855 RepID=A0A8C3B374_CAIMO